MTINSFPCARHSLVSAIGLTMVGLGEKSFKIRVLRRFENGFCKHTKYFL